MAIEIIKKIIKKMIMAVEEQHFISNNYKFQGEV